MTPAPHGTISTSAESTRFRLLGVELRDLLINAKRALDEEIRTYPTPIPRCDAQFNHLYEQRSRISRILDRVNLALGRGDVTGDLAVAIGEFATAPPIVESVTEQGLRERIGLALASRQPLPTNASAAGPL